MDEGQESLHEKWYFLTQLELPRLNDSIFAILTVHLGSEQGVAHFSPGIIVLSTRFGGFYEKVA